MSEALLLTPQIEHADPCARYEISSYGTETPLPTAKPDLTPEAGTLLDAPIAYLYSPLYSEEEQEAGTLVEVRVPSEVPRVQGLVQFAWMGGDPGVDFPLVTLEMQVDGAWQAVTTGSGRAITNGPDILVTTTPDPLTPVEEQQTWTWYAAWQAVAHDGERAGLPEGVYRLKVEGASFVDDGASTWPWASEAYTVTSPEFRVVPASVSVSTSGNDVSAWLAAPARGYRLVGLDGAVRGANPLHDDVATLSFEMGDGSTQTVESSGTRGGGVTTFAGAIPEGAVSVTVTDAFGNSGSLALAE
jgi:hypothetical protein